MIKSPHFWNDLFWLLQGTQPYSFETSWSTILIFFFNHETVWKAILQLGPALWVKKTLHDVEMRRTQILFWVTFQLHQNKNSEPTNWKFCIIKGLNLGNYCICNLVFALKSQRTMTLEHRTYTMWHQFKIIFLVHNCTEILISQLIWSSLFASL